MCRADPVLAGFSIDSAPGGALVPTQLSKAAHLVSASVPNSQSLGAIFEGEVLRQLEITRNWRLVIVRAACHKWHVTNLCKCQE